MDNFNKNVTKASETFRAFDFGYSLNLFVSGLKDMLEFFKSGQASVDEETVKETIEGLEKALELYKVFDEEHGSLAEFMDYIKNNIENWWD